MSINNIKLLLTRDDIASILSSYGYDISERDYKFRLRDEKTPSAVINQNGTIHDYGNDFHGDIFDVLQEFNGIQFQEAVNIVKRHLNITDSNYLHQNKAILPHPKKEFTATLSDEVYSQIVRSINSFDAQNELQSFKNPDYSNEALSICPLWVFKQASEQAKQKFRDVTTYDALNQTLVIKIHDYNGKLISYKRRRLFDAKWISAKSTHPNNQCLVNNKAYKDENGNYKEHIYIVEGHHDFLTAVLLDIDVLMIPTVNYKSFNQYEINLLTCRDVICIPDHKDDDLSGVNCMRNLAKQIETIARNAKVFSLPLFLESENIPFNGDKLDLSEVVELWNDGLTAFVNTLDYVSDQNIFYHDKEIF